MTVKELIQELLKLPADAEVKRRMTVEYGTTEIESDRLNFGRQDRGY